MSKNAGIFWRIVFSAGAVVTFSHSAKALLIRSSLTTNITTGATTSSVVNDGATNDTSAGVNGIITLNNITQPFPGLIINGSDQESEGTPAKPGPFDILSSGSSSSVNNSGYTIRRIGTIGATDFASGATQFIASASGTFVSAPGATITLKWWEDSTNQQGATDVTNTPGILISNYSFTTTSGNQSFSYDSEPILIDNPNPFSMTLQFDYTLPNGGSLLSRGQAEQAVITSPTNVTEPTTLATLGLSFLAIIALHYRAQDRICSD